MFKHPPLLGFLIVVTSFLVADVGPFDLRAQTSAPTRILACESPTDACQKPDAHFEIVWTFNGTDGTASSPASLSGTHLTMEKFDSDSIVVRRVDLEGPTTGLSAVYTGSVRGAHISGTVQWSWPDHSGYPANGTFSAVLQDPLAPAEQPAATAASPGNVLPSELLVCENNGPCNAAWNIRGSEGTGTWFSRNPTHATLTILRSAPDNILIRRTDTTDGLSASYAGSLRGDHYAGVIIWSGSSNQATGSWTATVPQTTCITEPDLDSPAALRIGQNALMFHRDRDALGCYIVAAKTGDATAQTAVGLMYYQGREEVPQDYTQALLWLRKAADQGIYAAQRTVAEMYTAGQGTPRDPALAGIYTARADEQKHDFERQQELNERAADRRAQVLSSFVLGASFGFFLF